MNLTPDIIRALRDRGVNNAHIVRLQTGSAVLRKGDGREVRIELACQNGSLLLRCEICGHRLTIVEAEGRTTLEDRCDRCDSYYTVALLPRETVCLQPLSARFTLRPDGATRFEMECPRCQTSSTYTLPPARDKSTVPAATALGSPS